MYINIYKLNRNFPQMVSQVDKTRVVPESYKCDICGRMFKEASHFTKHKRGALCKKLALRAAKKIKKKVNITKGSLDRKSKLSVLHKPYQCNICAAKFCDKVNVELHLERQHHTHKQLWVEVSKSGGFSCPRCDRWFQEKRDLKEHQRQHTNPFLPRPESTLTVPQVETLTENHMPPINNVYYNGAPQHISTFASNQPPQPHHHLHHQPHHHHHHQQPPQQPHHPPPPLLPLTMPSSSLHLHNNLLNPPSFPVHNTQLATNTGQVLPLQNLNPLTPPQTIPSQPQTHHSLQQQLVSNNIINSNANIINNNNNNSSTIVQLESNNKSSNKLGKTSAYDKCKLSTSAKLCVCGDCGYKFIDVLNLEFHIQRKHPGSNILQTVNLGGGTVLFKTNNTSRNISSFIVENDQSKTNNKNPQTYDCLLCGYRTNGMNVILSHLQVVHGTNNTNFIQIIETLEIKKNAKGNRNSKKNKSNSNPDPVQRELKHSCNSCHLKFPSKAELIRHRIKDKQYMCGVCCFSSCSENAVNLHMASHNASYIATSSSELSTQNPNLMNSSSQYNFSPGDMLCWICGCLSPSILSLDDHLRTHGSIFVECRECNKSSDTLSSITTHLLTTHPQQEISLGFVITTPDQQPMVHNLVVSPEGSINVATTIFNSDCSSEEENSQNEVIDNDEVNEDDDKNKTVDEARGNENDLTSKEVSSHHRPSYACSECGACLSGASQLEEHLQMHQNPSSENSQNCNSNTSVVCNSNSSILVKVEGSIEFRCEECGFWREESEPVMRHIHAVHMSGNILHSVRLPSGVIQVYPIHVVTPISSLVSE